MIITHFHLSRPGIINGSSQAAGCNYMTFHWSQKMLPDFSLLALSLNFVNDNKSAPSSRTRASNSLRNSRAIVPNRHFFFYNARNTPYIVYTDRSASRWNRLRAVPCDRDGWSMMRGGAIVKLNRTRLRYPRDYQRAASRSAMRPAVVVYRITSISHPFPVVSINHRRSRV